MVAGFTTYTPTTSQLTMTAVSEEAKQLELELELAIQREDQMREAFDEYICDEECYDCLDCDYDHFDQFSDHFTSAMSTPALTASSTPAGMPSTPLLSPRESICVAEIAHNLSKAATVAKEEQGLGERLLSSLQAIGNSALNALMPYEIDDCDDGDADEEDALPPLRLVPRSKAANKACTPSPVLLLEPSRPGAHVRFLIQPRQQAALPLPAITALGPLFSLSGGASHGDFEGDEAYELCEEIEF